MIISKPNLTDFACCENELALMCPSCGCGNLHQLSVEVFNREREDAQTGNHVVIGSMNTSVDRDLSKNPSRRRDGLTVGLYCEQCSADVKLHGFQHKGTTYLEMNHVDKKES